MGNIPEEVLLALAVKNSGGGGGGGTSNYNDLSNQPQINGTTLSGNKTASDLGLVAAETGKGLSTNDFTDAYKTAIGDNTTAISGIKDGQAIDSFADVESALADKVDKVAGKGLSENDYTDADKAIVGGVTAALADKADKSSVKNEFIGTTDEWNALTTAQKKEYDTYQITDDYTGGSGLPNYSTTEQLTGQKWIDGKDIYFKTVNFGTLPNSTIKSVASGLSNVHIISIKGIANASSYAIPLPEASASGQNVQLYYDYTVDSVIVITSIDYSSYTESYVVLYYTKTA